jgi:[ribosomal protein S5]-alanine N-acetyltransferase
VMPAHLPRLVRAPIVLRAFTADDVDLVQWVASDPLIPLITSVPATPDLPGASAFIARQHARLRDGEGFSFAIADSTTDAALGQIGLWLTNLSQGRASIGYWIADHHRGRGHATRALGLISTWGLSLPGVHRLEVYVEPWNEGSWRAAENVGYQREGLLRSWQAVGGERRDMYVYSLLATDRSA